MQSKDIFSFRTWHSRFIIAMCIERQCTTPKSFSYLNKCFPSCASQCHYGYVDNTVCYSLSKLERGRRKGYLRTFHLILHYLTRTGFFSRLRYSFRTTRIIAMIVIIYSLVKDMVIQSIKVLNNMYVQVQVLIYLSCSNKSK